MINYYLNIYDNTPKELMLKLKKSLKENKKEFIVTANSQIFVEGLNNEIINSFLTDTSNIITADGISIVKTGKFFNVKINEKIVGVELCQDLIEYGIDNNLTIYVYGSKQEILEKMKKKYPYKKMIMKNGYDYKDDIIKNDILNIKPDIIIAALGVPRQELFLYDIYKKSTKGIFIGVGGSIDVISGSKKRAPIFFRKLNLEWLYRLIIEPTRIKKFVKYNLKLFFVARKSARKYKKYKIK